MISDLTYNDLNKADSLHGVIRQATYLFSAFLLIGLLLRGKIMSKKINLAGQKFGRWLVVKENGRSKWRDVLWECECECGATSLLKSCELRSGNTKSCGCLKKELMTKHGMVGTPTYETWHAMIQRCTNKNNIHYSYYGGRGITVCKAWLKFENFFKDMGERPDRLTIERLKNNLGYSKENCCWASRSEQRRNQRIRSDNTSGVIGVSWVKERKKYNAKIQIKHKTINLGSFDSLEQATEIRKNAEQKYWNK